MESIEVVFSKLLNTWRADESPTSMMADRAEHWAYREIVKLGQPAVPLILKELEKSPEPWFFALEKITGENPIPEEDRGRVQKMADAWLNWGREKGFLLSRAKLSDEEMLKIANDISGRYGLKAEFLPGIQRVGVGGDARAYTPVIVLVGPPPLHEQLAEISTEISNQTGIMGVTYDITRLNEYLYLPQPKSKKV